MFRAHGSTINDELAKEELNLLAKLIGTSDASQSNEAFRINLFDNVMTEEVEKRLDIILNMFVNCKKINYHWFF